MYSIPSTLHTEYTTYFSPSKLTHYLFYNTWLDLGSSRRVPPALAMRVVFAACHLARTPQSIPRQFHERVLSYIRTISFSLHYPPRHEHRLRLAPVDIVDSSTEENLRWSSQVDSTASIAWCKERTCFSSALKLLTLTLSLTLGENRQCWSARWR